MRCQKLCGAALPVPAQFAAITLKKVPLNFLEAHPLDEVLTRVGHISLSIQDNMFICARKSLCEGTATFF
jgi:hypothetical protein